MGIRFEEHRRTCPHFFHDDCAADLLKAGGVRKTREPGAWQGSLYTLAGGAPAHCPICRRDVDARMRVPKANDDPQAWFACVDVGSDGRLKRAHVIAVIVSQFPVDQAKLEAELPTLWAKWGALRPSGCHYLALRHHTVT